MLSLTLSRRQRGLTVIATRMALERSFNSLENQCSIRTPDPLGVNMERRGSEMRRFYSV
jgi:hypothetical protein